MTIFYRVIALIPLALCACDTGVTTSTRSQGAFYSGLSAAESKTPLGAFQMTLETKVSGQVLAWNLASGATGTIEPTATWKSTTDHWCRSFTETFTLPAASTRKRSGTACRVDETWKIVES